MDPGERAVRFINLLRHVKGEHAGKPFALRPWQEEVVRALFGTLLPDGRRQYRTAWLEVPRKNGKTTLAAALALYLLVADGEPGAEIYGAAADRDQASLVFDTAAGMARLSPYLRQRLRVVDSTKRIVDTRTLSVYRAIAADAPTAHGFNAHAIIADELHAWPSRDLWDVLRTSMGARRQPLIVAITTAGFDRQSIAWELHDYARKVIDGVVQDPTFYARIFAAPDDADWLDEAVWRAANPALGDFRSLEEMRTLAEQAKTQTAMQNTFRRLYLNQWTSSETRWLDPPTWAASAGVVDRGLLRGRECVAGLDLSTTTDMSALVLAFPLPDGVVAALPFFWIPEATADRAEKRDRVPYRTWAAQGYITLTPGDAVDYEAIEATIEALVSEFRIRELAYDPWNASMLVQHLQAGGMTVVPVRQVPGHLSPGAKYLEALVRQRKLHHGGHPILAWNMENVTLYQNGAGDFMPSKKKSRQRIDGIAALVTALARLVVKQPAPVVYEERGVLVV